MKTTMSAKQDELPNPGTDPETTPAHEPGCLDTVLEIRAGKERVTIPPAEPRDAPTIPHAVTKPWGAIKVRRTKHIRHRYYDCLDEILACCSPACQDTPEAVHNLRVNLKRAQAIVDVISFEKSKVPARMVKSLQALFKVAGTLRSAQIEFDLISSHYADTPFNPSYLHQLHDHKTRALHRYRAYLKKGPPSHVKKAITLLKKQIGKLSRKQIVHYLDAKQKLVARRLRRSVFREQELHLVRKVAKRYYLNLSFTDNNNAPLKDFLELLGAWHDRQIAFDHVLKAIHTGQFTASEREPLQKIKHLLLAEKENLYDRITSFYAEELMSKKRTRTPILQP